MLSSIPEEGRDIEIVPVDGGQRRLFRLTRLKVRVNRNRFSRAHVNGRFIPFVFARVAFERAPRHRTAIEPGCDDRDADVVSHVRVDHRAEDQVHIGMRRFADDRRSLVHFEEGHVRSAGDVEEHAARAVDGDVEQFAGDGILGGFLRPVVA